MLVPLGCALRFGGFEPKVSGSQKCHSNGRFSGPGSTCSAPALGTFAFRKESTMFSMPDVAVILVVILVIFGAGKLPEIGSALGKGLKDFKNAVEEEPPKKPKEKIESP